MSRVYFDHNATTKPHPNVLKGMENWALAWGNPSSVHETGRKPKELLRESRKAIAELIGAIPLEVIFESCGSEANNHVIKGAFFNEKSRGTGKNHYLVSSVEHPSIIKAFEFLKGQGADVEVIPVSAQRGIDLEAFERQVREDTVLVSCMLANNETGQIFPIKKMAKIASKVGALFHTDAVQALGKMLFNLKDLSVDFATFSSHKFYALRGCGVVYSRSGSTLNSLVAGGGQERGRRAGTENLMAIASLAEMGRLKEQIPQRIQDVKTLRDLLEKKVLESIEGVQVTGVSEKRLCNTSNLLIDGIDGETLLMNLDLRGFSVSTGAACSSGSQEPSPALRAMGLSHSEATASMRISLGWENTKEEVLEFCQVLSECVERIRSFDNDEMASSGVVS